jgi:ribosome maturation factor RimP
LDAVHRRARRWLRWFMRNTLAPQIEREIAPLVEAHGVDLVALEWFQGAGRGLLRVTIDRHGGDPRVQDASLGVSVDVLASVTRDVSAAMDSLEESGAVRVEIPYQLEVTSPGPERPLQKRADYARFKGLRARLDLTAAADKSVVKGILESVEDAPGAPAGAFLVTVLVAGKPVKVASAEIARARLEAVVVPKRNEKPGKGPSRRGERLAAREKSRAINEEHRRRTQAEGTSGAAGRAGSGEGGEEDQADGASAPSGAER